MKFYIEYREVKFPPCQPQLSQYTNWELWYGWQGWIEPAPGDTKLLFKIRENALNFLQNMEGGLWITNSVLNLESQVPLIYQTIAAREFQSCYYRKEDVYYQFRILEEKEENPWKLGLLEDLTLQDQKAVL